MRRMSTRTATGTTTWTPVRARLLANQQTAIDAASSPVHGDPATILVELLRRRLQAIATGEFRPDERLAQRLRLARLKRGETQMLLVGEAGGSPELLEVGEFD